MSKMSNWLRAGLVGAVAVAVLQLLAVIPCVGCLTWFLLYLAYGCIGALAAYWMPPLRQPGRAAQQGALAGAIAGAIGGTVLVILAVGVATILLPLEFFGYFMEGASIGPSAQFWETLAGLTRSIAFATSCYAVGVGMAAGLGALGALLFAVIKPD